ncbi:uncharacterized protein PgNI_02168 [Pyricularia grisea]|uniref:Uncharacterized protein n=1 Tax=Pyricularia grisea TaxID=148305 RepID=A0A6P8BMW3_PYRGI|nr:uncharacterized protein PgNI_02168 [Pyricularia grisea]TLD17944.1 hypothetical protein PgNI_02168 [Pyricularia grisea]
MITMDFFAVSRGYMDTVRRSIMVVPRPYCQEEM